MPAVRAYALQKTMRAMDLGVELGATTYVFWGGREGAEVDAAKDPVEAIKRFREAHQLPAASTSRDKKYELPLRARGQAERAARRHVLSDHRRAISRSSTTLDSSRTWSASIPRSPTSTWPGLNFCHVVAQAIDAGKLFHIDLNDQKFGRFDQDLRFGSESIKTLFFVVKLLEESGYDGPRHFDAHAYRSEDSDGVWDFARGCMRTYLLSARKRQKRFAADAEIQALLKELADTHGEKPLPAYSGAAADALKARSFDRVAIASKGLPYERLDQLVIELLLGVR